MSGDNTVSADSQYRPVAEDDFVSVTLFEQKIPPVIRQSPHLKLYVDGVRVRWSAWQLERYAERYFGEKISRERFREFRQLVPPTERMPELSSHPTVSDAVASAKSREGRSGFSMSSAPLAGLDGNDGEAMTRE